MNHRFAAELMTEEWRQEAIEAVKQAECKKEAKEEFEKRETEKRKALEEFQEALREVLKELEKTAKKTLLEIEISKAHQKKKLENLTRIDFFINRCANISDISYFSLFEKGGAAESFAQNSVLFPTEAILLSLSAIIMLYHSLNSDQKFTAASIFNVTTTTASALLSDISYINLMTGFCLGSYLFCLNSSISLIEIGIRLSQNIKNYLKETDPDKKNTHLQLILRDLSHLAIAIVSVLTIVAAFYFPPIAAAVHTLALLTVLLSLAQLIWKITPPQTKQKVKNHFNFFKPIKEENKPLPENHKTSPFPITALAFS